MNKQELRRAIRERKRAMTEAEIRSRSEILAEKFAASDAYKAAKTIYGYLPYNQEVRTVPMLRQAQRDPGAGPRALQAGLGQPDPAGAGHEVELVGCVLQDVTEELFPLRLEAVLDRVVVRDVGVVPGEDTGQEAEQRDHDRHEDRQGEPRLAEEAAAWPELELYVLRPPIVLGPHAMGAKDMLPGPVATQTVAGAALPQPNQPQPNQPQPQQPQPQQPQPGTTPPPTTTRPPTTRPTTTRATTPPAPDPDPTTESPDVKADCSFV